MSLEVAVVCGDFFYLRPGGRAGIDLTPQFHFARCGSNGGVCALRVFAVVCAELRRSLCLCVYVYVCVEREYCLCDGNDGEITFCRRVKKG